LIQLNEVNKRLFGEQVNDHIEKLNNLMGLATGEAIDEQCIQKACLASKLLGGSARMLGLEDWSSTLAKFRDLLEKSIVSRKCWDEQLAQVVSEILETEEQVVAEILTGEVDGINQSEIFEGLQREIEVLLRESVESAPDEMLSDQAIQECAEPCEEYDEQSEGFSTLDRLIGSLYRVKDQFREYLEEQNRSEDMVRDLEHAFGESEFYIGLLGGILDKLGESGKRFHSKVSSNTALDGVRDFFDLHSRVRGWNAKLNTRSDNFSLEREAASALALVLEGCLFDVCRMYEERKDFNLVVDVDVTNEGSYLFAKITDNGPDFLCDSEIDRDDTVAFYKGLLDTRSLLEKWGGLIWVEPDQGKSIRFQFTLPHTTMKTDYHTFTASGNNLAVPYHCIEGLLHLDGREVLYDGNGRYIMVSGTRILVYHVDELAAGEVGPMGDSDYVIILGMAEKRAGIFSDGPGSKVEGILEQLTEGNWASLSRYYLHQGEDEYPVLDVQSVLERINYMQGLEGTLRESGSFASGKDKGGSCQELKDPRV